MKLLNKFSLLVATIFVLASVYVSYNNSECSRCNKRGPSFTPNTAAQCAGYRACQDAQRNFCAEAERAADRRISFYQDPSVSEELDREYKVLKKRCKEQNPGYRFQEERQLEQQEMTEISF